MQLRAIIEKLYAASEDENKTSKETLSEVKKIIFELNAQRIKKISSVMEVKQFNSKTEMIQEISIDTQQTKTGKTALILATENGHPEIALALIEAGAKLDIQDYNGNTALTIAACYSNNSSSINSKFVITHALIAAGAKVDIQNHLKDTALIMATWSHYRETVYALIKAKAQINIQGRYQYTALHWAVNEKDEELVLALIRSGAQLDFQNSDGKTALIKAVIKHNSEITQLLIESKAKLNIRDNTGNTALHWATGFHQAAHSLIRAGAELELTNNEGDTPLDRAIRHERFFAVSLLLDAGAIVHNPKKLFELLKKEDQREPYVVNILQKLCQTPRMMIEDINEEKTIWADLDYNEVEEYLKKLMRLEKLIGRHDEQRKAIFNMVDENIDIIITESAKKKMPTDMIDIITSYHYPSLSGLPFFKANDIDKLLLESKKNNDSVVARVKK